MKTIERKTKIYFESFEHRESAIDFLLRLKLKCNWTYIRAFPVITVPAKIFVKHNLDLYLTGIKSMASTFKYKL